MNFDLFHVDAFTSDPFHGNPAAVCLVEKEMPDDWLQNMGAEMNLAETAFLICLSQNRYALRWFTPAVEVELCGHATLASTQVLFDEKLVDDQKPIVFETRSGKLIAERKNGRIALDFPSEPPVGCETPSGLERALGISILYCGRNRFDYLVEVESESAVREMKPDLAALEALGSRGVVVTARAEATADADFISRAFFPNVGIAEDPVTGSAHCMLGPYWAQKLDRDTLTGYQASKRGGYVHVKMKGARVELLGDAVIVFKAMMTSHVTAQK